MMCFSLIAFLSHSIIKIVRCEGKKNQIPLITRGYTMNIVCCTSMEHCYVLDEPTLDVKLVLNRQYEDDGRRCVGVANFYLYIRGKGGDLLRLVGGKLGRSATDHNTNGYDWVHFDLTRTEVTVMPKIFEELLNEKTTLTISPESQCHLEGIFPADTGYAPWGNLRTKPRVERRYF